MKKVRLFKTLKSIDVPTRILPLTKGRAHFSVSADCRTIKLVILRLNKIRQLIVIVRNGHMKFFMA
jgi:hypothetical protein